MPQQAVQAPVPHLGRLDLYNNGVEHDVIIMKVNKVNGDIFFIRIDYLDDIDKRRALMILRKRDAHRYEAWDLFSQVTLRNGVNALEYFHQYVKVRTRSGEIMTPNLYRAGAARPRLNTQTMGETYQAMQQEEQQPQVRKAGRPPKANKQ